MSPNASYCGECRGVRYDDDFTNCDYEDCDSGLFEHRSRHGYYCNYCLDKGIEQKRILEKDGDYFCNNKCYKLHIKQLQQEEKEERDKKKEDKIYIIPEGSHIPKGSLRNLKEYVDILNIN